MARKNNKGHNRAIIGAQELNMSSARQYNGLLSTIRYSAAGLSLAELQQRHPDIPRRTLQRWTQKWLQQEIIAADGQGRGRRYMSPRYGLIGVAEPVGGYGDEIALSADSRDILKHVRIPWRQRPEVHYERSFLDAYQPNKSAYLSASLRYQLHRMGTPLEEEAPTGTFAKTILDRLLIDLPWASSQLEGNTYTLLDTAKLIQRNLPGEGKSELETVMILNHKSAIEFMVENTDEIQFNRYTALNIHATLAEDLLANRADEGRLRELPIGIGQSAFTPLPATLLLGELFDEMLSKGSLIKDPFEQSFFVLVHLPHLQPFIDVNKRTARLLANLPLLKANLCPLTFIGVPKQAFVEGVLGVYEMNRVELLRDIFVYAYQKSVNEYLTLKRDLSMPDPQTRRYRPVIKRIVKEVVQRHDEPTLDIVDAEIAKHVDPADRADVRSLIVQALSLLDEGRLVRYGLRPLELKRWLEAQNGL